MAPLSTEPLLSQRWGVRGGGGGGPEGAAPAVPSCLVLRRLVPWLVVEDLPDAPTHMANCR